MQIAGYLKTSLIEWPGKITSVIFVPGCNFRCPFCHNADLADPERCRRLPLIPEKEIFEDLKKREKWVDGVTITGGEPTLQTDLSRFLSRCKQMGFLIMIETNGSRPEKLKLIVNRKPLIVDYLAVDFKGPLNKSYSETVGVKNFKPKTWVKSIQIILQARIPFELRTTVVPGIHGKDVLMTMAKQLSRLAISESRITSWFLQNFQPKNCLDKEFEKIKPFGRQELESFLAAVKKILPQTKLRGV